MQDRFGDYGGFNNKLKKPGTYAIEPLAEAVQATAPQAYSSLFELLGNKGRVDPAAMNRTLSSIDRSTQNQQRQFGGAMAAGGNEGSGVAKAVQAAIGQGGTNKRADVLSKEARDAEILRRQDLDMFMRMVMDPAMGFTGIERQADAAEGQGGNAWDQILQGLGMGMDAWGTFGSGGAKP